MILAAGLLVLLGLGLFVGGVLTGTTAFYWGCVAACVVAAVLLFLARRKLTAGAGSRPASERAARGVPTAEPTSPPAQGGPSGGTAAMPAPEQEAAPAAAPAGATAASVAGPDTAGELADPPVEEVEVTDLLLVVDLKDEVLVIDEHPRYHLPGCPHVAGRTTIPIPLDEARTDGFTPCAVCSPDRNLAQRARERRANPGT